MNSWNGFDFLVFFIFAVNMLLGMARGASKEIISMLCLSVALIGTIKFTVPLTDFCNNSPLMLDVVTSRFAQNFMAAIGFGPLTTADLMELFYSISFLICFVGAFSVCEGVLSVTGVMEMYSFPYVALNRKVGAVLGCTRGYVISLVFISIFTLHIFKGSHHPFFSNSFFVNLFHSSAVNLDSIISGQQPEQYREIFKDKHLYDATQMQKILQPDTDEIKTGIQ